MLLGYPDIRTDLRFTNVPTVPLEQRVGVEKTKMKKEPNENNNENNNDTITDGFDTSSPCVDIRENNFFPLHRLFTDSQKLIIQGTMNSSISLDNITLFGIRPPELLHNSRKSAVTSGGFM